MILKTYWRHDGMDSIVNLTDAEKALFPPFSVSISVYKNDNASYLNRSLNSITVEQTVIPSEIVLIVDGPVNDDINKVICKYENEFGIFKVIRLGQNGGLGNALKIAIENAKHELIARMDSDDVSVPTRFEQQLRFFHQHPDTDIVGGDITEFIGEESNMVGMRRVPKTNDDIREYMKKRCAFNHMSVMFKKRAVQKAGGYQDWFWNEDYYLWIRMWIKDAVFANTGTVLVNVRVGVEMYQRRGGWEYFKSEAKLQGLMMKNGMVGLPRYIVNVTQRLVLQVLMPNWLRGVVFRMFARRRN